MSVWASGAPHLFPSPIIVRSFMKALDNNSIWICVVYQLVRVIVERLVSWRKTWITGYLWIIEMSMNKSGDQ